MNIIGTEAVGFIIGNVILTLPASILLVFAPDKTNKLRFDVEYS